MRVFCESAWGFFQGVLKVLWLETQIQIQRGNLDNYHAKSLRLLIGAFRSLRSDLKGEMRETKEEMHAGEARTNKRIDEVKEEMKEFKQEMGEIKTLLIQALRLPPPGQP